MLRIGLAWLATMKSARCGQHSATAHSLHDIGS
jgi:hypothetical protein